MPFRRILTELMDSVPGSVGAVFADEEGEAVDQVSHNGDTYHVRFFGAHHGILFDATRRAVAATDMGTPKLLEIRTEKVDYFTAYVHDGYFIVLAVEAGSPSIRAHLAMEKAIDHVREEMGY